MNKSINAVLLVGSTSPEREVSKMSSKAVYEAMISLGYNTRVIDPALGTEQLTDVAKYFEYGKDYGKLSDDFHVKCINSNLFDNVDIVFIGLHGKWGEDGRIQALLDFKGIKYTGSDFYSSALSMDKNHCKTLFRHNGIGTSKWKQFSLHNYSNLDLYTYINEINYPCVVKPNDGGSSIGLTIVHNENELESAVGTAFKYSKNILVEQYIKGRELTVAILGDEALPPLEIKPKNEYYDYEAKYTAGKSEYIVPAQIPDETANQLRKNALAAHQILGCSNYSRVDFLLDESYNSYCLEVNTLPGMTQYSLVPKMAKAVGIDFNMLIDKIIKNALESGR